MSPNVQLESEIVSIWASPLYPNFLELLMWFYILFYPMSKRSVKFSNWHGLIQHLLLWEGATYLPDDRQTLTSLRGNKTKDNLHRSEPNWLSAKFWIRSITKFIFVSNACSGDSNLQDYIRNHKASTAILGLRMGVPSIFIGSCNGKHKVDNQIKHHLF